MKRAKVKQFIVCISTIMTLFASSVAACACSHHQEKPSENVPACHKHSKQNQSEQDQDAAIEAADTKVACVCAQFVSKITVKSETVKFEKQAAAVSAITPVTFVSVSRSSLSNLWFFKPPYLSDSFYNLSPGRAPPVL